MTEALARPSIKECTWKRLQLNHPSHRTTFRLTMHTSPLPFLAFLCGLAAALPQVRSFTYNDISLGVTDSPAVLRNISFDYVVCGGGLTGLTVASRLSEDPNISVLVIEVLKLDIPIEGSTPAHNSLGRIRQPHQPLGERCSNIWRRFRDRIRLHPEINSCVMAEWLYTQPGGRQDARRKRQSERR